jgi:nitroreductase
MTAAEEKQLFDLAFETPSSFNIQHWRIVVARDPELRANIREAAWGQPQMTDASLLLILCADVKAWEKDPARYWETASQEVRNYLLPMINNFHNGREEVQRDEALRSVGMIAQTIMLTAKDMGYDSCPMIGFDPVRVAELINLPSDHIIGMMIAVGKGTKPANPKGGYLPRETVVLTDRF